MGSRSSGQPNSGSATVAAGPTYAHTVPGAGLPTTSRRAATSSSARIGSSHEHCRLGYGGEQFGTQRSTSREFGRDPYTRSGRPTAPAHDSGGGDGIVYLWALSAAADHRRPPALRALQPTSARRHEGSRIIRPARHTTSRSSARPPLSQPDPIITQGD